MLPALRSIESVGNPATSPAAVDVSVIACEALTRRFGEADAIRGVSFSVEEGEFFALLGPNGAGKSTILNILTTILAPDTGRACVAGHDVVFEPDAVRAGIGVVFQEPALDDRLTGRENLRIHAALYAIPRAVTARVVEDALTWSALGTAADRSVATYSGGMKRRLELARALMHRPSVLFLDEPTLGLDPQGRRQLWASLDRLRTGGLTVLMTTHNLSEAEACHRVGVIDEGRLRALGPPNRLRADAGLPAGATLEEVFLAITGRDLRDEPAGPRGRLLAFGRKGGEQTR